MIEPSLAQPILDHIHEKLCWGRGRSKTVCFSPGLFGTRQKQHYEDMSCTNDSWDMSPGGKSDWKAHPAPKGKEFQKSSFSYHIWQKKKLLGECQNQPQISQYKP